MTHRVLVTSDVHRTYTFLSASLVTSLITLCLLLFCPGLALASGGITEFTGPLEKVVNTLTGPAGKYIGIVGMGICGIYYIFNKEDLAGGFKMLLGVVFGISFIAFAGSIVNTVFSFSGAVI